MIQEIAVYIILASTVAYLLWKFSANFRSKPKKTACGSCEGCSCSVQRKI